MKGFFGVDRSIVRSIDLKGPTIAIPARLVMVITLIFHELTTNSIKYGSLSNATGRILVTWSRTEADEVSIQWTETGGPPVTPPVRKGFGSELLTKMVASEGGSTSYEFHSDGLRCSIHLKLAAATETQPA